MIVVFSAALFKETEIMFCLKEITFSTMFRFNNAGAYTVIFEK